MQLHRWHGTIRLIQHALAEDEAAADATSGLLPDDLDGRAAMVAKEPGVIAGTAIALEVFRQVDASLDCAAEAQDGAWVEPGERIASISGRLSSILRAERTALNFAQRLSGIATSARAYADAVAGTGRDPHRHAQDAPWLAAAGQVRRAHGGRPQPPHEPRGRRAGQGQTTSPPLRPWARPLAISSRERGAPPPHTVRVEVECDTLEQVREALDAGADIVMLDNMTLEQMREGRGALQGPRPHRGVRRRDAGDGARHRRKRGVDRRLLRAPSPTPSAPSTSRSTSRPSARPSS